jgi:hypothetical protein
MWRPLTSLPRASPSSSAGAVAGLWAAAFAVHLALISEIAASATPVAGNPLQHMDAHYGHRNVRMGHT